MCTKAPKEVNNHVAQMHVVTGRHRFRNAVQVCSHVCFDKLWKDKPQAIYSSSLQEKGWDSGGVKNKILIIYQIWFCVLFL